MNTFIQSGDRFSLADLTATHQQLPKGNYMLKMDSRTGEFFFSKKKDFELPKKLYGTYDIIQRWKKSFENNSEKNLGIILSGIKGTGKTITAQKFCMEMNCPVILITKPYMGPEFIDFLTSPSVGNAIIFIDEFEKIYSDRETQVDILSLMDGNYPTKLIFLLTVNTFNINEYLINRLNRVKYRKDYGDLDQDIVNEVIDEMLINKSHRESIFKFFEKVNMWTFDLLTNIIKEMNLFREDALECGKHLNLEAADAWFEVFEVVGDEEYRCDDTDVTFGYDIDVRRKEIDYLNPPEPISKDSMGRNKYAEGVLIPRKEVRLQIDKCEVDKCNPTTFTVRDPNNNVKFKFYRRQTKHLIF